MAGEVTDPRVKAILLGGGAMAAGAPFVAGAMSGSQRPIDRARASRIARAAPASRGVLGTLGRFSGPVGAAAGMLMPSQLGDGTLQGNEQMLDPTLNRSMFGGQPPQAAGTGITSGLETTPEQEAEMEGTLSELAGGLQSMNDDIDNAEDYVGIMNAIRGDDQSIDQRRNELAGYIGKEDAGKTPESALTLIQPSLTLLDSAEQGSQEEGGAIADDGIMSMLGELGGQGAMQGAADAMQGGQPMQAPGQGEAMARMAMGEQPVMRSGGSENQGENTINSANLPASFNLQNYQTLMGLVPKAQTTAELLPQYQALYKDSAKAYELNPYISGLQLAAAVANAPEGELFSSVLAPETIKAVSDPILQMAQAKGQSGIAAKKGAMEAAAKSKAVADEAKNKMLSTFATEAAKIPDLNIQKLNDGTIYGINVRTGEVASTIAGRKFDKTEKLGNGQVMLIDTSSANPTVEGDGFKVIGTAKGDFTHTISNTGDIVVLDKDTGNVDIKTVEGQTKPFEVYQTAQGQFFKLTPDGVATPIEAAGIEMGPVPTDLVQNVTALTDLRTKLKGLNTKDNIEEYKSTLGKIELLQQNLMPKTSEFERLLAAKEKLVYDTVLKTDGEEKAQAAMLQYRGEITEKYLQNKITPTLNYNPRKATDEVFAKLLGRDVEGINENATKTAGLRDFATQAADASGQFQTGSLSGTRLATQKFVNAVPGLGKYLQDTMSKDAYNAIFGGSVVSAEIIETASNQFSLRMSQYVQGNLNTEELRMVKGAGPSLYTSKEGLQYLAEIYTKSAERAVKEQQFVQSWMQNANEQNAYTSAEDKYLALSAARTQFALDNQVVDQATINALPQGDLKPFTATNNSGVEVRMSENLYNMAAQVQKYPDLNTFKANIGTIVQQGLLQDPNGKVITNVPKDEYVEKLWSQLSGLTLSGRI